MVQIVLKLLWFQPVLTAKIGQESHIDLNPEILVTSLTKFPKMAGFRVRTAVFCPNAGQSLLLLNLKIHLAGPAS